MKSKRPIGNWLYFAYGSNMNMEQMKVRCYSATPLAVAKLANHKVGFFGYSKVWDGAQETVVPTPGHDVWGVVYQLSFSDGDMLDAWQDVRLDGTGPYFHYPHWVEDRHGNPYDVMFYKKDILGQPQKPSEEYLNWILTGARQHKLPEAYISTLGAIPSVKAQYPVPRHSKFDKASLLRALCSGCDSCGPSSS